MIFHRGLNDSFPSSTVLFHPTIQLTKSSVSSYSALIDHNLTKISNYMQQLEDKVCIKTVYIVKQLEGKLFIKCVLV